MERHFCFVYVALILFSISSFFWGIVYYFGYPTTDKWFTRIISALILWGLAEIYKIIGMLYFKKDVTKLVKEKKK